MNILYIFVGLGVLGLMVIVHEWGHYVAARFFGVRVLTFSVGFGTRLFGIKRGTTDFCVRAIPLGGYVKMAGENIFEEREGTPDEFYSKPRWQRSIIAFAGPLVNIILAVVLLTGLYMAPFERDAYQSSAPVLAGVMEDSPAAAAGMRIGDRILSIDDEPMPDWEAVRIRTLLTAEESLSVRILRGDDEEVVINLQPEAQGTDGLAFVGWLPETSVVIQTLAPDMPAEMAGLKIGDEVIAIDGERFAPGGAGAFSERIRSSEGSPVVLTYIRGGETFDAEIRAEESDWTGEKAYAIGIRMALATEVMQLGFVDALNRSVSHNWESIRLIGKLVRRLFAGTSELSSVQGPIGITVISGQMAQLGLGPLVGLMAMISINLGVINLLPIPILDGGHIATFAVEGLLRRDLSLRLKERFMQLGFLALMMLFAVVMYNDVVRYFFR